LVYSYNSFFTTGTAFTFYFISSYKGVPFFFAASVGEPIRLEGTGTGYFFVELVLFSIGGSRLEVEAACP
jgi:hypothetical protein